jgi:hypothetical protein
MMLQTHAITPLVTMSVLAGVGLRRALRVFGGVVCRNWIRDEGLDGELASGPSRSVWPKRAGRNCLAPSLSQVRPFPPAAPPRSARPLSPCLQRQVLQISHRKIPRLVNPTRKPLAL